VKIATGADAESINGWLRKGEQLSAEVHGASLCDFVAHVHNFLRQIDNL
jgi:hypothetical protein